MHYAKHSMSFKNVWISQYKALIIQFTLLFSVNKRGIDREKAR